ncbi:GTP cyclohydrolase I FolE [Bartonella sp. DGB1]|uniref:GTP cyclohydrolase I FolE n=1 Tax=Bartonella sp. DGB1 TaxID=3239807 RepID=UPI00352632AF
MPTDTSSIINKQKIDRPTQEEAEEAVKTLLLWAGEDPNREGLIDTPKRVVTAYKELFSGYDNSDKKLSNTVFNEISGYCDPVLVKNIEFFSHCEHHMLPFTGVAHISYLPNNCVIGLSKIARIVDLFAKRFQTQEALTAQIGSFIQNNINPKGIAIMIEAEHMCMAIRGIKKLGSSTITTSYYGEYKDNENYQQQFLNLVNRNNLQK